MRRVIEASIPHACLQGLGGNPDNFDIRLRRPIRQGISTCCEKSPEAVSEPAGVREEDSKAGCMDGLEADLLGKFPQRAVNGLFAVVEEATGKLQSPALDGRPKLANQRKRPVSRDRYDRDVIGQLQPVKGSELGALRIKHRSFNERQPWRYHRRSSFAYPMLNIIIHCLAFIQLQFFCFKRLSEVFKHGNSALRYAVWCGMGNA
jgi:hypothetical protein